MVEITNALARKETTMTASIGSNQLGRRLMASKVASGCRNIPERRLRPESSAEISASGPGAVMDHSCAFPSSYVAAVWWPTPCGLPGTTGFYLGLGSESKQQCEPVILGGGAGSLRCNSEPLFFRFLILGRISLSRVFGGSR